jgi:polysaccharide export outer membrane protein
MMNPGNYFLGQHFVMRDKDMLYYSNAKANNFYKLFGLISTIIQPGITAGYMVALGKGQDARPKRIRAVFD